MRGERVLLNDFLRLPKGDGKIDGYYARSWFAIGCNLFCDLIDKLGKEIEHHTIGIGVVLCECVTSLVCEVGFFAAKSGENIGIPCTLYAFVRCFALFCITRTQNSSVATANIIHHHS